MNIKDLFASLGLDVDEAGFKKADGLFGALNKSLLAIGAAVAGAGAGLAVLVRQTANAGDEAAKAAQRYGVSTETIQELGYAAGFAGASIDEVGQALQFLARKGSKDVTGDFQRFADTVAAMPDGGEKTALVIEKLGMRAGALIPLLNGGAKGLADMATEARGLGAILDGDTAKASERFNDTLDRIRKRVTGLRNRLIGPWIATFEKALVKVEKVVAKLSNAVAFLVRWLDVVALVIGSTLLAAVIAAAGGFKALLLSVVSAGLSMLVTAAQAVVAWTAAAAPVAALVLLFVALGLLIDEIYTALTGGETLMGELANRWVAFLDSWYAEQDGDGWLTNAIKALLAAVGDLGASVPQAIDFWIDAFKRFFRWVGEQFSYLSARAMQALEAPLGALRRLFGGGTPAGPVPTAPTATGPEAFGGGASPQASAGSTTSRVTTVAPSFAANFSITTQPGQNAQDVAGVVRNELDAWHNAKMRETLAAVGA